MVLEGGVDLPVRRLVDLPRNERRSRLLEAAVAGGVADLPDHVDYDLGNGPNRTEAVNARSKQFARCSGSLFGGLAEFLQGLFKLTWRRKRS
jgi:hypothetical protein